MFENILEKLKNPVTILIEKAEEEDIKKGCIKLAIISFIMSFLNTISRVIAIISRYSKKDYWYKDYTTSELWAERWDAIKETELLSGFFKTWVIIAVAIAISALILFIIAKIVKSPKEYSNNLSMINNILIIYSIGFAFKILFSLIYAPLGLIILYATMLYATLTLINAYRESLDIENTDILVVTTTAVLTIAIIITLIIISSFSGVSLSDLTSVTKFLNLKY
mgnify:CR=1 FL=1